MTPRHLYARELAMAGIPVFPCISDAAGCDLPDGEKKRPACANGFKDATTNLEQINAWWEQEDYNIGVCPEDAGWAVLDEDPRHGAEHLADLPRTRIARTPSGGRHYYYLGSLPPSAGKLAPGWDTRGRGSYVLVPPSIIGGIEYEWANNDDIADLPDWIAEFFSRQDHEKRVAITDRLDQPASIARALALVEAYVAKGDVARAGSRNDRTYRLACEVQNLGLSGDTTLSLLKEHWNPHAQPPLDHDELTGIVEHAGTYAQNESGTWAVPGAEESFLSDTLQALTPAPHPEKRSRFHPEDDVEMDRTPPAHWLVEGILQQGSTCMVYGPTQSFKTFLVLDVALGIATGQEALGIRPQLVGPAFFATNEGRGDLKRKRRVAWRTARQVDGVTQFYVMPTPMIVFPEEVQEFGDQIEKRCAGKAPALIVLETVSKMMVGLDPTRDAPRLIRFCDSLVEHFGCAVVALHHTGHDAARGPRDSSAYHAGFDTVIEIKGDRHSKTSVLTVVKHKDQEEPEQPYLFRGKPIANSLVFDPIGPEEYARLTSKPKALAPSAVGAALRALDAIGPERAVTTRVLADALTPSLQTETPEQREACVERTERELRKLAKGLLAAYTQREGRELQWFLPA